MNIFNVMDRAGMINSFGQCVTRTPPKYAARNLIRAVLLKVL